MDDFQDTPRNVAFIQHPLSNLASTKSGTTNSTPAAGNTSPQANLQFIHLNSSTGPRQDDTTKQFVRSHVMKGFQEWKHSKKDENSRRRIGGTRAILREKTKTVRGEYEEERVEVVESGLAMKRVRVEQVETTPRDLSDSTHDTSLGIQTYKPWNPLIKTRTRKDRGKSSKKPERERPQIRDFHSNTTTHGESLTNIQHMDRYPEVDFSLPSPFRKREAYTSDPFSSTPTLGSPRLQMLIHHYNTNMSQTLLPLNPRNKWFSHALTDPALLHATLLHSCVHRALLAGSADMEEVFAIRRDTIGIVNRRMGDERERISDVTIGAVACLALFENQSGNKDVSNIHMDGLQRMVEMRGGLENLDLSGILPRLILWADLANALLTLSHLRFSVHGSISNLIATTTNHPDTINSTDNTSQLPQILQTLSTLSRLVSPTNHDGSISDSIYAVERHLLSISRSCVSASSTASLPSPLLLLHQQEDLTAECSRQVSIATCEAGLIYTYLFLRDCLAPAPLFGVFLSRLRTALVPRRCCCPNTHGAVGGVRCWVGMEEVLLWVLVLGALVAGGRDGEGEMFVGLLAEVCGTLGVRSESELRAWLYKVAWREGGGEEGLRRLWGEVLEGMGV